MNPNKNKIIESYLREIKKKTPSAYRARLIDELSCLIADYNDHNPINQIDVLYQVFGRPNDYVNEYISSLDSSSINSSLQHQKRRNLLLISLASIMILFLFISFLWIMNEGHRHTSTYYFVESIQEESNTLLKQDITP